MKDEVLENAKPFTKLYFENEKLNERLEELENQLQVTGNELSLLSDENKKLKLALERIVNAKEEYFLNEYVEEVDQIAFNALINSKYNISFNESWR